MYHKLKFSALIEIVQTICYRYPESVSCARTVGGVVGLVFRGAAIATMNFWKAGQRMPFQEG